MAGRFKDLRKKHMTPARIEKARGRAEAEALEMDLRAVREAAGMTQVEAAPLIEMTQSELSRYERREDHRISTLRRYVHALGGSLKIIAEVNKKQITLSDG